MLSTTQLHAYPAPIVPDEDIGMGGVVFSKQYNNGADQWLYLADHDPSTDYPGGVKIGEWNPDGTPVGAIHTDYDSYIRPFGNDSGSATNQLDYHKGAGTAQRHLQETPVVDTLAQYRDVFQPIILTFEYRYDDTPGFEGHGWKATIEFSDPTRAPNARAIGIYNDAWGYLYTTGAFVYTDTGEVDDEGQPIFKWQTINPAGFATPTREDVYYALLLGAAQEGRMILGAAQDTRTDFYWEHDQGVTVDLTGNAVASTSGGQTLADKVIAQDCTTSILTFDNRESVAVDDAPGAGIPLIKKAMVTVPGTTYRIRGDVHNDDAVGNGKVHVFNGNLEALPVSGGGDLLTYNPPKLAEWQEYDETFVASGTEATICLRTKTNRVAYFSWIEVSE